MVQQLLLKKLVAMEDYIVPTLFKPVQFNIIKKLDQGKKLDENEKRYLRGKMKKKLALLEQLSSKAERTNQLNLFVDSLGSYYVTGLAALKHNGFGWYFEPKIMEIINTKIEGNVHINNISLKLIRVKSMQKKEYITDEETNVNYAINKQILKDVAVTKNEYTKDVCIQMLSRYKNMFIKEYKQFKSLIITERVIDYKAFGV